MPQQRFVLGQVYRLALIVDEGHSGYRPSGGAAHPGGIWKGVRIVELEAARRYTPNEVAATFTKILGQPVRAEAVARETWGSLFESQARVRVHQLHHAFGAQLENSLVRKCSPLAGSLIGVRTSAFEGR